MANVPFTALPNLNPPAAATIVPVVASGVNYTVTMANLQTYVNSTTGNIQGNYILGNGSQLTGLPATYSNANVVTLLAAFGSNTISTTGNITGGNVSATGNVQGSYILGNGSQLTGIATSSYGNANVATFMAAFGSNAVSTTGNVSASYYTGNGSLLTGITASGGTSIVNGTSNVSIPSANGSIGLYANGGYGGGNTASIILSATDGNINFIPGGVVSGPAGFTNLEGYTNINVLYVGGTYTPYIQSYYAGTFIKNLVATSNIAVPSNTAVATRTITGAIGQMRAITDSSTVHGRLCFWDTTNSRWSYVSDNTAV